MSDQTSDQETAPTDEKPEQPFDQTESGPKEVKPPKNPSSGGSWGSALAILLSLLAIGIAAYPAWEIYQQKLTGPDTPVNTLPQEFARVEGKVAALGKDLQRVDANLKTLSEQLSAGVEESRSFREGLTNELQSLRGRMGTSSQDWVYAEVEYLVRMANQRVLMERDGTSALQLLQAADDIIRGTDGLTAHGLRQALASDIAALRSVNAVDTQGVYLELSAMIAQVPSLRRPLPTYQATVAEIPSETVATGLMARTLAFIKLAGSTLAGLVDFRRGGVEVKPILPPEEAYFLRQNLVLKLQIAQMALLEGNSNVFRTALGEATGWVSDSFDEADGSTMAMLESLGRLSATEIAVDLPDLSGSLKAARRHVAGSHETLSHETLSHETLSRKTGSGEVLPE